jgi:AmiR/NasT family two-component response regulator
MVAFVVSDDPAETLEAALRDLAAASSLAEHLQLAVVSNRRIGMAMGILMERHRLTEDQAFERLRDLSQRRNVKLRDLAEQMIYIGDVDPRRD